MYTNKVRICVVWVGVALLAQLHPSAMCANDLKDASKRSGLKIRGVGADLVEISNPKIGYKQFKLTSGLPNSNSNSEVPELVIQVEDINYGDYEDHYTFWQEVHIFDSHEMLVADTDQDGRIEVIGIRDYVSDRTPEGEPEFYLKLYELDDSQIFQPVYDFPPSTNTPWWAGDLDNDGNQEVLSRLRYLNVDSMIWGHQILHFESPSLYEFPSGLIYADTLAFSAQPNHVNIVDIDRDGNFEMLYYLDGGDLYGEPCPYATHIAEYNPSLGWFEEKFCFEQDAFYTSHYAIGDWDLDGKTEFATGGWEGELYILEATGDDTYDLIWEDTLNTNNAYLSTTTNDINWNGKPELWIGGDVGWGPEDTGPETRIFCLESNGDDSFEIIYKIRIPGIFSWGANGINATDINQDGTDELLLWVEDYIFILEGTGNLPDEILYAKKNHYGFVPPYDYYQSVTSKDLNGDGYPELLVSLSDGLREDTRWFTRMFRPADPLLSVDPIEQPGTFELIKAYPNPFNSSITISWDGLSESLERIEFYDTNGLLVNRYLFKHEPTSKRGQYIWNGNTADGKEVNSGVYFARLWAGKFNRTVKVTLLR